VTEPDVALRRALADRYRIENELGAGGMATVYLAQDLKHQRKVAIKVLRQELAASLGTERFLKEIETTASLRHPHILPLYDSGEAGGLLYYVMPLVEGESLRDRLTRERQLPIDQALGIAREIADALGYAHRRGIIHRDIKPENILLEGGHAVVADFGIARAVSVAAGTERLTQTGLSIGTPLYMSPEQAAGSSELDGRSDIYGLACVVYEMLCGEPPFTGVSAAAITRQPCSPMLRRSPTSVRPSRPERRTRWRAHSRRIPPTVSAQRRISRRRSGQQCHWNPVRSGRHQVPAGHDCCGRSELQVLLRWWPLLRGSASAIQSWAADPRSSASLFCRWTTRPAIRHRDSSPRG
jgi:serine/threonine protein kinase